MKAAVTLTSKGQMTLPAKVREELGLRAGDRLELSLTSDGEIRMRKSSRSFDAVRGIVEIDGAADKIDQWVEEARGEMAARGLR